MNKNSNLLVEEGGAGVGCSESHGHPRKDKYIVVIDY